MHYYVPSAVIVLLIMTMSGDAAVVPGWSSSSSSPPPPTASSKPTAAAARGNPLLPNLQDIAQGLVAHLQLELPPSVAARDRELLQSYHDRETFSACWRDAVARLHSSCAAELVDQQARSRLSLAFTNCQLTGDGKSHLTASCPESHDISKCVARLDDKIYTVYLQFRLHIDTLCFYVQQDLVQRRAEATVRELHFAAAVTRDHIRDLSNSTEANVALMHELAQQQHHVHHAATEAAAQLADIRRSQERLNVDVKRKEDSIKNIGAVVEIINDRQTALSESLGRSMREAEEVSRRQVESMNRIVLSAEGIKRGIDETRLASAQLLADHGSIARGLSDVREQVRNLHEAQDASTVKAQAVTEQLSSLMDNLGFEAAKQLTVLQQMHSQALQIATEARSQQENALLSSQNILGTLDRLHGTMDYVSNVAVSLESLLFYIAFALCVVLVTTARQVSESRFSALVLGPVLCLVTEKWFFREACVALYALGLVEESPWSSMVGDHSTSARRDSMRMLRFCFSAVVGMIFFRAWARYEPPEAQQRRVLAAVVEQALHKAFTEYGGVATTSSTTNVQTSSRSQPCARPAIARALSLGEGLDTLVDSPNPALPS